MREESCWCRLGTIFQNNQKVMFHLRVTTFYFIFCMGICVIVYNSVYQTPSILRSSTFQHSPPTCRSFSEYCKPFLAGHGKRWQQRDCLSKAYFTAREPNCSCLVEEFHFITEPLSQEEEEYPLAFIIVIHKELEMFMRLLRAIYTPQNVYCIHVDAKVPQSYMTTVSQLVGCLPNVFLASTREKVAYAGFSRLKADIHCMADLAKSPVPWRKVVNLCGQDFPIKTNLELVRFLQSRKWKSKNMTPGVKQPPYMQYRTQKQYVETNGSYVVSKGKRFSKGPPPHNLDIYFGTAYYVLTRPFVDFVLQSNVAKDLLEWSRDTYSPDEHYWVTLNHLKEAPGYNPNGNWSGNIRAIKWRHHEDTKHKGCKGHYVRNICIYSVEDLPWVIATDSMFANKFDTQLFPEAVDCLELWHRQKVLQQARIPIRPEWHLAIDQEHEQRAQK